MEYFEHVAGTVMVTSSDGQTKQASVMAISIFGQNGWSSRASAGMKKGDEGSTGK